MVAHELHISSNMKSLLFLIPFFSSLAMACDISVVKTMVPWNSQTTHTGLCIDRYFEGRHLLTTSISDEIPVLFEDLDNMVFDDMLLVELNNSAPLEERGRLEVLKKIFSSYKQSLKNPWGACDLKMYSGENEISFEDFHISSREEGGQPGTRRMLTKDDVSKPSWRVFCPNSAGQKVLLKRGDYFFVFVDFYENKTLTSTKAHFAKFLFSLR